MNLWASARKTWPDRVNAWNVAGIRWREFSAVEILWMIHRDNMVAFAENHRGMMRQYLNAVRDYDSLAAWDAQSFNETDKSVGEV